MLIMIINLMFISTRERSTQRIREEAGAEQQRGGEVEEYGQFSKRIMFVFAA